MGRFVLLALSLLTFTALSAARPRIPEKPATLPAFHVPREGSRPLDENWIYQQTLYDANIANPSEWGAVPVAMEFTHNGRGFIGCLHTVFRTLDAGRTWTNLDPQPPPFPSPAFTPLREPFYLNDLAIHPAASPEQTLDSLYLAIFNSNEEEGVIRLIRAIGGGHYMWPDTLFVSNRWLTTIVAPDSGTGIALAGLDAQIYRNDSIRTSTAWDTLPYNFGGTWVKEATTTGNFIYAVGSNQWLSLDRGYSWQTLPASDIRGDADIYFAPQSARAIVCGPGDETQLGFVRYTTDFGQTWSPRALTTAVPLRTALMVNDTLGYVAGGDVALGIGQIWRTTDGGENWTLDIQVDAEITELAAVRESGAYVNIIATGYYADFRGAVWRSPIFMPDTGAVIYTDPDTLIFTSEPGEIAQLATVVRNDGDVEINLTDVVTSAPFFASCCPTDVLLLPGDTLALTITFAPTDTGNFISTLRVVNDLNQLVEVIAIGTAQSSAANPIVPPIPDDVTLSVYPNPGNAEFRISYSLPRSDHVSLRIFDVSGREIASLVNDTKQAGEHVQPWDAREFASGIYFVALQSATVTRTEKIVLVK